MAWSMGLLGGAGYTVAALGSFDLLQTGDLTSGAGANISFNSLSTYAADYQHFQIRAAIRTTAGGSGDGLVTQFNGDTASNYYQTRLQQSGTSVAASAQQTSSIISGYVEGNGATAGSFGVVIIDILDPFETSKSTSVRSLSGHVVGNGLLFSSGVWNNSAALSSIVLKSEAGNNLAQYSRASLYGIKAA